MNTSSISPILPSRNGALTLVSNKAVPQHAASPEFYCARRLDQSRCSRSGVSTIYLGDCGQLPILELHCSRLHHQEVASSNYMGDCRQSTLVTGFSVLRYWRSNGCFDRFGKYPMPSSENRTTTGACCRSSVYGSTIAVVASGTGGSAAQCREV